MKGQGERGGKGNKALSLSKAERLPKASEGSQGFLRPQRGPRGTGRLRGQGGVRGTKGEQGP